MTISMETSKMTTKFTADASVLRKALTTVRKAINPKHCAPTLQCVRVETQGSGIVLTGTDLITSVRVFVKASVDGTWTGLVPARVLVEALKGAKGPITFEPHDMMVSVISGGSTRELLTQVDIESYPNVPMPSDANAVMQMPDGELQRLLSRTAYAVSRDVTRPHMCAVYFDATSGKLRVAATDGHRLTLTHSLLHTKPWSALVQSVSIPALESLRGPMTIHQREKHTWFVAGDVCVGARLLMDASFPNYEQVIPQKTESVLRVKREAFHAAVNACHVGGSEGITFTVDFDGVGMRAEDPDHGIAKSECTAVWSGEKPLTVGFNRRYMLDVLESTDADAVSIQLDGDMDPACIRMRDDSLCVLMPMRI